MTRNEDAPGISVNADISVGSGFHAVPSSALVDAFREQDSGLAILLLDVEGRIQHATVAAEQLFGHSRSELLNSHLSELCCDLSDGEFAEELKRASTGALNEDRCFTALDGRQVWASTTIAPLRTRDGALQGYAVTAHDVTVRRGHEASLRQIVEMSLTAIVLVDQRGMIISVNAQTETMFGYPRKLLIGHPVEILVPERFRSDHPRNRASFFSNPVVRPMGAGRDLFGRRSDGTEFPVEIGLSPVQTVDGPAVLGSIVDITKRYRAERRFRLAVESALYAKVMINREGRIVLVNRQTERLFGYEREELLGELVEILVPERYRGRHPQYRDDFLAMPSVRAMGAGRELYGRRKDGSEFPIEIGLNPIDTGDESLVLSAIVDITARKEAEERVRKHLADLAHVARLSTVGQMFSELAHEINQPLAAAANYARACVTFAKSEKGITTEQMIEWMEKTAAQTTRAIEIVKRLGSFVKKDGGARSFVNLNELIEQVVKLSVPVMQTISDNSPPIGLELDLDRTMPEVHVDRVQIEQVLLNLVRNAVEAMQDAAAAPHRLKLQTRYDDADITVSVSDTGGGITPENLAKLFEPYFPTKSSGMGLGLSISRAIGEDHGGQLRAEVIPGGTTFQFTLPIGKMGQPL